MLALDFHRFRHVIVIAIFTQINMTPTRFLPFAVLALVATGASGCATYQRISNAETGSTKVFSGTRMNLAAMRGDESALRRLPGTPPRRPALDLPLSLVLDTALLQMTVPVALYELVFE